MSGRQARAKARNRRAKHSCYNVRCPFCQEATGTARGLPHHRLAGSQHGVGQPYIGTRNCNSASCDNLSFAQQARVEVVGVGPQVGPALALDPAAGLQTGAALCLMVQGPTGGTWRAMHAAMRPPCCKRAGVQEH